MLAFISARAPAKGPIADLLGLYEKRIGAYGFFSRKSFTTEAALLRSVEDLASRTRPLLLLADSRGQQISSQDLAQILGRAQDDGVQMLILAIGPADGWSPQALDRANRTIAFGRITLPHELAAVIAAEQIYRALTIRAGHPYHSGH